MNEQQDQAVEEVDGGLHQALNDQEPDFSVAAPRKMQVGRGTILLIALAAAGLGGTWFMYQRSGPRRADAETVAKAKAADQTIHSFLNDGAANRKLMEQLLHNTQKVVRRFMNYPLASQVPLRDLKSNPFERPAVAATPQQDVSRVQQQQEQEARRSALIKSAQAMKLQSIIHSEHMQACMIDNNLYKQGQKIGDFTVASIQPNAVILQCDAYRFELTMGK